MFERKWSLDCEVKREPRLIYIGVLRLDPKVPLSSSPRETTNAITDGFEAEVILQHVSKRRAAKCGEFVAGTCAWCRRSAN